MNIPRAASIGIAKGRLSTMARARFTRSCRRITCWAIGRTSPRDASCPRTGGDMNSDLSLDFLRVVEQAAIACAHTMGQGDGHKSDQAAVEAMRSSLDSVPIDGTIVIGEGERDEAPMLYIGEKVGVAHALDGLGPAGRVPQVDIAVG